MDKEEIESKIRGLLGQSNGNRKKWVAYGIIGGFIGGYFTATTATTLRYNAEVRKTLTKAHRPLSEQPRVFDMYKEVGDLDIPRELPPPFKL